MARTERLSRTAAKTADDAGTLLEDLEALGGQIARLGERTLSEGQEKLAEEIQRLKAGADSLARRVGEQGQDTLDSIADTVQRRPVASLLSAFAAGVVLSLLIGRRGA